MSLIMISCLIVGCNDADSPPSNDQTAGETTIAGTDAGKRVTSPTAQSDPRAFFESLGGRVSPPGAPADKVMVLNLINSKVTDADLVHAKSFPDLIRVSLVSTQISDKGLVHLKGLHKLRIIELINTSVTDEGLVHLKDLPKLMTLNLDGTQVSDAGLEQLKGFKSFHATIPLTVTLNNTKVSEEGRREFAKAQGEAFFNPPE